MKETLIIYRDWWEAIKSLPTDLQLEAYNAVCSYAFEGTEPENPMISAVTALMRSAIDRDKAKWEDVREKRRIAGRRGAQSTNAKRWGENTTQQESSKSANAGKCRQMPTTPEPTPEPPATDKEELSLLEQDFEAFRLKYPGSKRGLAIEFANLKKKYPKQWKQIVPKLMPAVERLLAYHEKAKEAKAHGANIFLPNFAYLSTWINNARWEDEFPAIDTPATPGASTPSAIEPDYSETDFGGRKY